MIHSQATSVRALATITLLFLGVLAGRSTTLASFHAPAFASSSRLAHSFPTSCSWAQSSSSSSATTKKSFFSARRPASRWTSSRSSSYSVQSRTGTKSSTKLCAAFISPAAAGFAAFDSFAAANPYTAAFLSCAWNGFMADCVAQRSERYQAMKKQQQPLSSPSSAIATTPPPPFQQNYRRTLAFILYGGCYQGASLHFIYNDLFLRWFGPNNPLIKTMVSQLIMAPFLTLPVAYMFKGLVFGKSIKQALQDYYVGLTQKGLLFSFWKLWVPIQFLVFTVIPPHLRMPFSSFFSFLWTVILSRISNST